jgi:hypothetical protein
LKTIPQLVDFGVRIDQRLTTAAVVGGFLLRRLSRPLVDPTIFAVLEKYQVFKNHFSTYMFFASTGMDLGHLITFQFIGCIVALAVTAVPQLLCPEFAPAQWLSSRKSHFLRRPETVTEALEPV